MKYGITLAGVPVAHKPSIARRAQEAGLDSVWVDDNPGSDAVVSLGAIAAVAPDVRVGSGILRAFSRHPITIASAFSELAALSRAGTILGLGAGTKRQNLFQYGLDVPKPVARLRSVIDMVRAYWDASAHGVSFAWSDEYYTINDGRPAPPVRADARLSVGPPIWIAAVNQGMLRLAGETADGLAGHPVFSVDYIRNVVRPVIDRARAAKGVTRPFELAAWAMVAFDTDRDRARRRAARQIAFYLSTRAYTSLLEYYDRAALSAPLRDAILARGDLAAAAAVIDPDLIDRIALTGTVEQVAEQLSRYDGVADSVVLAVAGAGASVDDRLRDVDAAHTLARALTRERSAEAV